jgi:hypothetical protein
VPPGYGSFQEVLSSSHYAAYLNNKLEGVWKEAIVAYVQVGYFPERLEENQGISQVSWCLGKHSNLFGSIGDGAFLL